jgi:hypothetical protein
MEALIMKASLIFAFSMVAITVTILIVEKSPLSVAAQELPPLPGGLPQPPVNPIPPLKDKKDVDPAGYTFPPPGQTAPTPLDIPGTSVQGAQAEQLRQLIGRLKDLRRQEKDITEQIQKVIAAQKKSLEDAQDELRQLGIEGQRTPPSFLDKKDFKK